MTITQKLCFLFAGIVNFIWFAVMNYSSWNRAHTEFNAPTRIQFDHDGYSWGWPFDMFNNYTGFPSNDVGFSPGLIFNVLAFLIATSLLGIIFIWLFDKFYFVRKDLPG